MPLNEQDRQKLDGIVSQMQSNKESDSNIQAVVDDFKGKYDKPADQPQSGLSQAYDFAKGTVENVASSLNPANIYQAFRHPIEPMLAELQKAKEAHDQGNTMEAMARIATGVFPVIGPMIGNMAEQPAKLMYGETPEARGQAFGTMISPVVGAKAVGAVGSVLEKAAPVLYKSALRPSAKMSPEAVTQAVTKGQEAGIMVGTKGGIVKANQIVNDLGKQVDAKIAAQGGTIDPTDVATRADQIRPKFNTVTAAADQAAIDKVQTGFLNQQPSQMSLQEAQQMKQNTYRSLKERAYGEQKGPSVEAEKALARGLKEELEAQVPELKALNTDQQATIRLEKALQSAIRRTPGLMSTMVGTPVAGAVGYMLGGAKVAAELVALKTILERPEFKSALAIAINRASQLNIPKTPLNPALYGQGDQQP